MGPDIMEWEFERAVKELKTNKAPGIDKISGDVIKVLGKNATSRLFLIIKEWYEKGWLPKDFEKSIIITIPKRQGTASCSEHRTLSLLSHPSEILTKIICRRISDKIESELEELQFGFRKEIGCREASLCVKMIIEKRMVINKPTYVAFVDLEKAFDNVNWEKMFDILKKNRSWLQRQTNNLQFV